MLKQPANLDVLFKFATLASQTGDYEGAISALERMLLINADLPRVRLELGVLYYRLGSFELARRYLEVALKTPDLPPEVRKKGEDFLAQIASNQNKSHFTGDFFLGWRYQSDANFGPATTNVVLFGQTASINQSAVGASDWGLVGTMALRHTYDFGRQDNSALETQLIAYGNRQFNLSAANISFFDMTTGPRFQILQDKFENMTLKPLLAGGYVWVNDTPYYGSYGVGLEGTVLITDALRNVTTLAARQQNYPDTWYLPANDVYTGLLTSAATNFRYALTPTIDLTVNGSVQRFGAQQTPAQSYTTAGVGGSYTFRFAAPIFKFGLPWSISLSYQATWWTYDQPDPTIDPNNARMQYDGAFSVALTVPLDDRTNFVVSGGQFARQSNIINYQFINNNVMFGIGWRF